MKKIIALFDDNFVPMGFADLTDGRLAFSAIDGATVLSDKAAAVFSSLEQRAPRRRKEFLSDTHGIVVDAEEVKKSDPDYLSAVAEELQESGVSAVLVPASLKEAVIRLGRAIMNGEDRKNILGDMIYAPEDEVEVIVAFIKTLEELEARS